MDVKDRIYKILAELNQELENLERTKEGLEDYHAEEKAKRYYKRVINKTTWRMKAFITHCKEEVNWNALTNLEKVGLLKNGSI